MRRPLFCFSALFVAALALELRLGPMGGLPVFPCVLLSCLVFLRNRRAAAGTLLCGLLAFCLAFGVGAGFRARLAGWQALEGETAAFSGWVREADPYDPGRALIQGEVRWRGERRRVLLDLRGAGEEPAPGRWLSGQVLVLEAREDGEAPGGVSLFGTAQGEPVEIPRPKGFFPGADLAALRWELSQRVYGAAPGDASAVVAAMVFSRGDLLPQGLLEQMTRAGARHLLVVSGLHLSIAVGWTLAACRLLGLGRRGGSLAALAAVWLLAGMAGFTVSVLRAAAASTLWLLGRLMDKRADGLTSLGLAALALALLSPPVLFRTGWQLTFSAALGLLLGAGDVSALLAQGWEGRFGKPPGRGVRWALEGTASGLCAQLGTLPVLASSFGYFTLWGLASNLLAMPFVTGVILLGGLGAALSLGPLAPAGGLLLAGARRLAGVLIRGAGLLSRLPGCAVPVRLPWQLLLCFFVSAGAPAWMKIRPWLTPRGGRSLRRALLLAGLLSLAYGGLYCRGAVLVSADGGTGTVVVSAPGGVAALAEGGGGYRRRMLSEQLLRCGGEGPLALVRPWDSDPNETLWWCDSLSPRTTLAPGDQVPLLEGQLPGEYLPLTAEPLEVLPGLWVSSPSPYLTLVETAGGTVVKCWAGYGALRAQDLPAGADLLIDREGRMYPLSPWLRPRAMPSGDAVALLRPGLGPTRRFAP